MDGSFFTNLRVWAMDGPALHESLATSAAHVLPGPHYPAQFAERLFVSEALTPMPPPAETEPYSLQWFLNIESRRHSRHGRWIPRVLEFAKHANETLLGIGDGLGTDWIQYARHGANVVVCSPSMEQLGLIRRNFELRGLGGRFLHAGPSHLPLESASIDVACLSSLVHESPDPAPTVAEIYRVLKPGGKVLAVTPAKYDANFWQRVCFPWPAWFGFARPTQTTPRYSSRRLRRLFGQFVEHRIYKRQLRRSELPHLWRFAPLPLLERLMGRFLIIKAFKPLSAAIALQAAA